MAGLITKEEAIDYIENTLKMEVTDLSKFKYRIEDKPYEVDFCLRDDKELIDYANEQKEANEDI